MRSIWLSLGLSLIPAVASAQTVDFARQLQPILEAKCLSCHNPNNSKGDLSLAEAKDVLDAERSLIVPGRALESDLYMAVITEDPDERPAMPQKGDPLSDSEAKLLRQWIEQGAQWPDGLVLHEPSKADKSWWAYQPLQLGGHNSIDAYINQKLDTAELKTNPPADRRSLIRRATYDLTGLPPSRAEVDAFISDDAPGAYRRLVDRLLDSPRYGEHWSTLR